MTKRQASRPRTLTLGLGHLLRIRRDQLVFYDEMKVRHGDSVLLRLGPYRSWLLFDPDLVEQVLTRRWQSFIRFEKLTHVVAQWTGDNMLLSEGDIWRERRRKVLPAFKTTRLPGYGEKAVDHAKRLCNTLETMAAADGTASFGTDAVMARLTLDIAAATFFDTEPPENGEEIERAIQILSATAFRESTSPFTLPDWLPLRAKRLKLWAMNVMDRLVSDLVEARLDDTVSDRGDLLSILIEEHKGDRKAIRDDAMSLLIAGHETSGALLSWVFYCLVRNPEWRAKLMIENRDRLAGRQPTPADLAAMPLLRAAIEETLRLYPPAYALFLRRAIETVEIDGLTIRRGDLVQIMPYTIHRDARWFPNPERFDPERFLTEPTWPRFAYLPFGAGPRVCIGQSFGLMEACLVVATILQRWEPMAIDRAIVPDPKFSLRPRDGLPMTWRKAG